MLGTPISLRTLSALSCASKQRIHSVSGYAKPSRLWEVLHHLDLDGFLHPLLLETQWLEFLSIHQNLAHMKFVLYVQNLHEVFLTQLQIIVNGIV
jgi:hypothetical protein